MSEIVTTTEAPAAPKKRRTVHRRKRAAAKAKPPSAPPPDSVKWAGATRTACPTGCTPEHCLVSTVNVCKHPFMTGDAGCGPITNKNREQLRRYLKHQDADR